MPGPQRPAPRRAATLAAAAALTLLLDPDPDAARADGLSPDEQRIVAAVDALHGEAVAVLEKAVNVPSATQNLPGVRAVGDVFAAEFARAGFSTRWESLPAAMNRAGHLVAERAGTGGKRVMLIGHLDTVLEGRKYEPVPPGARPVPDAPPGANVDGAHGTGGRTGPRARGTGTSDMKGGDVVILLALRALQQNGALDGRRVAAILTGDEEDAGSPFAVSRAAMVDLARRSDVALAFESGSEETAVVARRGVCSWTLKVTSRTGHSAGANRPGGSSGAIFEAARVLEAFRAELVGIKDLTFNASLALGGTEVEHDPLANKGRAGGKTNVVPGMTVVEGDLRYTSDDQRAEAEEKMRAIVAKSLPRSQSSIAFDAGYPAMAPTPGNYAALAVLDGVSKDLGFGPVKAFDPGKRGAGDISFVAPYVDGLDGLGASGGGSHGPEEFVYLESIRRQAKRAALLIYRLTRDGAPVASKP